MDDRRETPRPEAVRRLKKVPHLPRRTGLIRQQDSQPGKSILAPGLTTHCGSGVKCRQRDRRERGQIPVRWFGHPVSPTVGKANQHRQTRGNQPSPPDRRSVPGHQHNTPKPPGSTWNTLAPAAGLTRTPPIQSRAGATKRPRLPKKTSRARQPTNLPEFQIEKVETEGICNIGGPLGENPEGGVGVLSRRRSDLGRFLYI